jgi:hypothetical protein
MSIWWLICGLDGGQKWAFPFEMHMALTTLPCATRWQVNSKVRPRLPITNTSVDICLLSATNSEIIANFYLLLHEWRHLTNSVTSQTGNDFTRRYSDHGSLLVSIHVSRLLCTVHNVISDFSGIINGGLSISTARGVANRKLRRHSIVQTRFVIRVECILMFL